MRVYIKATENYGEITIIKTITKNYNGVYTRKISIQTIKLN